MNSWSIVPVLLLLGLCSCDRAKRLVDAARGKMGGAADPGAPAVPGGKVDQDFAGQVDSAADGVRFRRDLDFPASLSIRLVERQTFRNARMITKSELGREAATYNGTWEMVGSIKLDPNQFSLSIEKFGELLAPADESKKAAAPAPVMDNRLPFGNEVAGAQVSLARTGNGWRMRQVKGVMDFRNQVLGGELVPVLPELLTIHGGVPRGQWFSSNRRWTGGDRIQLEGDALALLFPGRSGGKVTLVFEEPEALEGHPCGRFAVEGDVKLAGRTGLDGAVRDREISIQSGKIWCSLIHPLVLREEYQTLQTIVTGAGRGPQTKIQGVVDQVIDRRWRS